MSQPTPNLIDLLTRNLQADKLFAVATVIAGGEHVGAKLVIYPDGSTEGDLGAAKLNASVLAIALPQMRQEKSETRSLGELQVFIETFAPSPKLIIVGGVHTAIPLAAYAQILGFRVTIVDGRGRFATRERFPNVDELIIEWPDDALPKLPIEDSTYVVILTHDPKFDLPALTALSTMQPRYIGAMGSRETRRQHMEQLRAQGIPDEFLKTVYGPVGLDLGARTPEEMALAIIAEMIAVRHGRSGGHLKG